jgi:hypothetical protein
LESCPDTITVIVITKRIEKQTIFFIWSDFDIKLVILNEMSNHGTICQIFIQGSIFLKSCVVSVKVAANGTAVEVVCVTGAASWFLVLFVSSETIPVASRYGAIFAITVCEGYCAIAVHVVC